MAPKPFGTICSLDIVWTACFNPATTDQSLFESDRKPTHLHVVGLELVVGFRVAGELGDATAILVHHREQRIQLLTNQRRWLRKIANFRRTNHGKGWSKSSRSAIPNQVSDFQQGIRASLIVLICTFSATVNKITPALQKLRMIRYFFDHTGILALHGSWDTTNCDFKHPKTKFRKIYGCVKIFM